MAGCRQDMHDQPSYRPLQSSDYFKDRRAARPLVDGTVARGQLKEDVEYFTGKRRVAMSRVNAAAPQARPAAQGTQPRDGQSASADMFAPDLISEFPFPVTRAVVQRGRERFNIFCTPCHGYTGQGNGMVAQRGLGPPPSFHSDRLRQAPVGHFFDVVTNGFGAMYSYSSRIPVADRWAIIAYVRTLQRAYAGTVADVPEADREKLQAQPQDQDVRITDNRPAASQTGVAGQGQIVPPQPATPRDAGPGGVR
jgi:hypothetical protein